MLPLGQPYRGVFGDQRLDLSGLPNLILRVLQDLLWAQLTAMTVRPGGRSGVFICGKKTCSR